MASRGRTGAFSFVCTGLFLPTLLIFFAFRWRSSNISLAAARNYPTYQTPSNRSSATLKSRCVLVR